MKGKISQNFVAFSEYMNFKLGHIFAFSTRAKYHQKCVFSTKTEFCEWEKVVILKGQKSSIPAIVKCKKCIDVTHLCLTWFYILRSSRFTMSRIRKFCPKITMTLYAFWDWYIIWYEKMANFKLQMTKLTYVK